MIIEADRVSHWNRQIETPYSKLSEREKEYDREEVRKYIPFLSAALHRAVEKSGREMVGEIVNTLEEVIELNKELPSTFQEQSYHQSKGWIDHRSLALSKLDTIINFKK